MDFFKNNCILCLQLNTDPTTIKSVHSKDRDGSIEGKIKYILSETNITLYYNQIVSYKPEIPKYICKKCLKELNNLYKFKQKCLKKLKLLKECLGETDREINRKLLESAINDAVSAYREEKEEGTMKAAEKSENIHTNNVESKVETQKSQRFDFYPPQTFTEDNETKKINFEEIVIKMEPADFHNEIEIWEDPILPKMEPEDISDLHHEIEIKEEPTVPEDTLNTTNNGGYVASSITNCPTPRKIKFLCDICNKIFYNRVEIIRHRQMHANRSCKKCKFCKELFTNQENLDFHIDRDHKKNNRNTCNICYFICQNRSELVYHKKTHEPKMLHECNICEKKFANKNLLGRHQKVHLKNRCQYCEIFLPSVESLKIHLKTHKHKIFKCNVCQYELESVALLKYHMVLHNDKKECSICKRVFKSMKGLRTHRTAIHSSATYFDPHGYVI